MSYIGLSAAQIENATKSNSSSAEYVQPKRIINVYYDMAQSGYYKRRPGDRITLSNTSFSGLGIPEETKDPQQNEGGTVPPNSKQILSDSIRNDSPTPEYPEVKFDLSTPYKRFFFATHKNID